MTFIFDTGSSWLWIPSDACPKSECPGTTYHYGQSTTYSQTSSTYTITYGQGTVKGYIVSDQVGLSSDGSYTATGAKFLSIYNASDISSISTDGLLGLSPKFMSGNSGELFITSLIKSGVIKKGLFGLYLASTSKQSKMFFGGYDDSYVTMFYSQEEIGNKTADELITWMSINSQNYWQVSFNGATVGSTSLKLSVSNLVLDSGSSLMYVPSKDYSQLYSAIMSNNTSTCSKSSSGITYCTCSGINDSQYPNITLKLGGRYQFYLNNSDYLLYDSSRGQCIFTFLEDTTSSKFWLLGDPFLRTYFVIHDMDNQKIGLAGKFVDLGVSSTSTSESSSSSEDSEENPFYDYILWIIVALGGVFLIIILVYIYYRCCQSKPTQPMNKDKVQNSEINASKGNGPNSDNRRLNQQSPTNLQQEQNDQFLKKKESNGYFSELQTSVDSNEPLTNKKIDNPYKTTGFYFGGKFYQFDLGPQQERIQPRKNPFAPQNEIPPAPQYQQYPPPRPQPRYNQNQYTQNHSYQDQYRANRQRERSYDDFNNNQNHGRNIDYHNHPQQQSHRQYYNHRNYDNHYYDRQNDNRVQQPPPNYNNQGRRQQQNNPMYGVQDYFYGRFGQGRDNYY